MVAEGLNLCAHIHVAYICVHMYVRTHTHTQELCLSNRKPLTSISHYVRQVSMDRQDWEHIGRELARGDSPGALDHGQHQGTAGAGSDVSESKARVLSCPSSPSTPVHLCHLLSLDYQPISGTHSSLLTLFTRVHMLISFENTLTDAPKIPLFQLSRCS